MAAYPCGLGPYRWVQRELSRSGVEKELVRAGVGDGDLVRFGEVELEWGDAWE